MKRRLDEVQMSEGEQILDGVVSVCEVLAYLDQDRYLNLAQASEYLSISKRTIRDLADVPRYRIGSELLLFKKSELDQWMEQYRVQPTTEDVSELVDEVLEEIGE